MKRIIVLLIAIISISMTATAQIQPVKERPMPIDSLSDYEVLKDPKNGQKVYRGIFSFKDLQKEPEFSWLQKGMDDYHPDDKAMKYLNEHLRAYDIRVFLGTWCEDSHDLIPRFYKVLQGIGFMPMNNLVLGLDRDKTTKDLYMYQVKDSRITLLPTIILINSAGKEAGRITETADKTIEEDLVRIIKKDVKK